MFLFNSGPLFNRFIETSATDLKHRQPMPKHTFVSPQPFCVVPNPVVYDGPVDPLNRFNPPLCLENATPACTHDQPSLQGCNRLFGVPDVLIDGGEQQIPSQPERKGLQHIFKNHHGFVASHLVRPLPP